MSSTAWDPIWEELHSNGRMPTTTWPPDDMIRQVARATKGYPDKQKLKVLDLGCGSGPMTWYLARNGYDTFAIDGSPTSISSTCRRLDHDGLHANLQVGDLTKLPWCDGTFDICIEIQSLMCNNIATTKLCISEVWRVLKPGGIFISRTPSDRCYGYGLGVKVERNVWTDADSGPFQSMGTVRFLSYDDAKSIYSPFTILSTERTETTIDNMVRTLSFFILVCQKRTA